MTEGTTWLDTGTHKSLLQAALFVSVIEERHSKRICCPEVSAHNNGWINDEQLTSLAELLEKSIYGLYLKKYLVENSSMSIMPSKLISQNKWPHVCFLKL